MKSDCVDRTVFDDLRATTGDDFVRELVDTFLEEAPGLLAELSTAHAQGDADAFRRAAHSLKSNALTFGALKLGELAREHEGSGLPRGDFQNEPLERALAEASAILRELCNG